jgi:CRP-like cAMP-binding protein
MSISVSSPFQLRNNLLAALISSDYQYLLTKLERVHLALGEIVYRADSKISYVYFPEDAVISLLATLESGGTTEVGLIGREGMAGLVIFLDGDLAHDLAQASVAGTAMRMKASVLREELRLGSPLQLLLLRYTKSFIALLTQSIICSQHHLLVQRLARHLLMMHDYVESDKLRLTQEVISNMLGARRAGVAKAALILRDAGLISYVRGQITILDRTGLEVRTCECYEVIKKEFDDLYSNQLSIKRSA